MTKVLLPILVILALVVGGLALLKRAAGPMDNGHSSATAEIREGATLPDFQLQRYKGDTVQVSSIPAKVFLINFWATWCEACILEMPSIVKLRKEYKDRGFEVLPINLDEDPQAVLDKALKDYKIDFPAYTDPESKLSDLFDIHAIPLTVVMDGNRKILLVETGERDWNSKVFRAQLEQWLKQQ